MLTFINTFNRLIIAGILFAIVITILLVTALEEKLPSVDTLKDIQLQTPLKIYTADGKLLAEYGEKRRSPIKLEQVPKDLINAIIAIEDRRFFQHPGVDLRGILRATVHLLMKGNKEQGGSTITMQVARNFFLTRKKTYLRKINEILLALKIEQELSKNEILELYLNKIYFGKRAYGIAAAAEVYYGSLVDELTLAQMAMLAGLPQAPSAINPIHSVEAALKRRNMVLDKMLAYGFITESQYNIAINTSVATTYHGHPIEVEAPYVAEMARQQIMDLVGDEAYSSGYEVITTIDGNYQKFANQALAKAILAYDKRHGFRKLATIEGATSPSPNKEQLLAWMKSLAQFSQVGALIPAVVTKVTDTNFEAVFADTKAVTVAWENMQWAKLAGKTAKQPQDIVNIGNIVYLQANAPGIWHLAQLPEVEGAIVAMQPDSGAILALSGGFDYTLSSFNRAAQAERQPGSSFKPFVYSAALANNFTTASIINDAPIIQEDPLGEHDWRPQNHTKKFYGPTRLRVGITQSRNLVSIRLLKALGIKNTIDFLVNLGFAKAKLPPGLSLALGTTEITPLEFTARYCTFPNGGFKIEPYLVSKVLNSQGKVIFEHNPAIAVAADAVAAEPGNKVLAAPRVLSAQVAYLTTSLLQDAIKNGTGRRALALGRNDLAGKTGTTNDHYDAWYAGYNRDLMVTTWMGFDEPRSLKEYAVTTALPMWMSFMAEALKGKPEHSPEQPAGIVTVRIDPDTGLLAKPGQVNAIYELFTEETVPTQQVPESSEGNAMPAVESLF